MTRRKRSHTIRYMGGGLKYLLSDEFITDRSTGAVNGTLAEPGPGTRVITDVNTKISITGGNLSVAAGAASNDGIWLSAITRASGRMAITTLKYYFGHRSQFGLFTNQGNAVENALISINATTAIKTESAAGPAVGSFVTDTVYKVCIVLRTAGAFHFIKGGAFTSWTMLWNNVTPNTATLYPGICFTLGTAALTTTTSDYIRIPKTTWMPTPLAYDLFSRANGALGSTSSTGPDNQACPSLAWTDQAGTQAISTLKAMCSALAGGLGISTVATGKADVIAEIAMTKATNGGGIILRYQDADNYLYCFHNGTNLQLVSREGGIETTLIDAAAAYGAGRFIRVVLSGTSCSAYYNYTQIGATQVVPASTYANHGLYFTDTDSSLDSFAVWAVGTGGEYSILDNWSS